jgi:hypothetical protein
MPIDARIPLGVTGLDPNGFINALAAGQKQRELENASARLDLAENRLARKDEAATTKSNALRKFGMSDRGPEAVRQLYIDAPDAAPAVEKNIRDAGFSAAQTDKLTTEATSKKLGVIGQILNGVTDEPTYQQARAQVLEIEPKAEKWPERYDPAFVEITKRRGLALGEQLKIKMAEDKAGQPQVANTSTDGLVTYDPNNPEAGVTQLPGQTPKAPPAPRYVDTPRGTMVMDPQNPMSPGPILPGTEKAPVETPQQRRIANQTIRNEAKLREAEAGGKQLTDATGALDAHLEKYGTETDIPIIGSLPFTGSHAAEQGTLHADVMAGIQKARQMGVLQPGEFPFLEMAAKNPTSIWNAHQADNIRAQLKELNAQVERGLARSRTQFAPPSGGPAPAGGGPAAAYPDTSPSLAKPQMVHSPEEFARLPSGTKFTAPDGSVRTKP